MSAFPVDEEDSPMQQLTLRAEQRAETGSAPARRLRRTGRVPAVVYGRDLPTKVVTVDAHDLTLTFHTDAGYNAVINLEIEGEKENILTVAREIQRHPVRGDIAHLDFIKISLTEVIEAEVVLEFTGIPLGVRADGGIFEVIRSTIMVSALPTAVPNSITADVTDLEIGSTRKLEDLDEIEGVAFLDDPDTPLASVQAPRLEVEEEEEVELDEEGEPIEGEEDEAPSEDEAE
jgi:large subunit ribosomal protein L25